MLEVSVKNSDRIFIACICIIIELPVLTAPNGSFKMRFNRERDRQRKTEREGELNVLKTWRYTHQINL